MAPGIVVGKEALLKKMMRKKKKTSLNVIKNRDTTIINSISKCLADVPDEEFTATEAQLKYSLLNLDGKCEYCEIHRASTEDHLFPLVKNRFPTDACNDEWNMVPSCGSCNSSKGNLSLEEWIGKSTPSNPFHRMDDETRERCLTKLKEYQKVADLHRYRKIFKEDIQVQDIITDMVAALQLVQDRTRILQETTTFQKGKPKTE